MNLSAKQLFLTEAAKALLENNEQLLFLNLSRYQLYDVNGVDALQLVKRLVGEGVARISPFESVDFIFTGYQYSVLRLGKDYYRLGLYGELGDYGSLTFAETILQAQMGLQVQARACDKMIEKNSICSNQQCFAIAIPDHAALSLLTKLAVVQPPRGLEGLQRNCAVLARINNLSVLIWRHQLLSQPIFELHTAVGDSEAIKLKLIHG